MWAQRCGAVALAVVAGLFHAPGVAVSEARTPSAPPQPSATGVIAGRVLTALDGVPLDGTRVSISSVATGESAVATTGANGHYAFTDLPSGEYRVIASRDGYSALAYGSPRSMLVGPSLILTPGERRDVVDFRLAAAADIVGRVTDVGGAPVGSAAVEAVRPIFQDGQVILAMYASAETDASGDYRLADLAGGRYYVRAHAPATDDDPQTARTGVPTYHPNTLAAADAEAVRVAPPSEPRRIDLTLRPVDTSAVSGRIMSGTGALLLGGAVTLTPHVGGRVVLGATIGSRVEPDGTFVFPDVPPGSFMIQVRALDEATPRMQFATFHIITSGRDVSNIVMTLRGGARVEGAVVVREGEGPESWDGLSVRTPTADPSAVGSDPIARVRPDGTFSLPAMQDGPRFFRIDGLPAGWTLDSVRYHGQDITDVPLDLQSGQQLSDLPLVIRAGQPSITGALRTSRGGIRTDRTVVAFSTNPGFWAPYARRVRLAQPDPSGGYALTGLPAGRYHVAVVEELDRSELFIEDRLQSLAETADTVLVQDDAVAKLDLTIPSPTDQR